MSITCELVARSMAQHMRVRLKRKACLCPARFTIQLKPSVVNDPPRSLTNTIGDVGASRFSFRKARSSSPRMGWVLGFAFRPADMKCGEFQSTCSHRTFYEQCVNAKTDSRADNNNYRNHFMSSGSIGAAEICNLCTAGVKK